LGKLLEALKQRKKERKEIKLKIAKLYLVIRATSTSAASPHRDNIGRGTESVGDSKGDLELENPNLKFQNKKLLSKWCADQTDLIIKIPNLNPYF